jgi:hypothetical protein
MHLTNLSNILVIPGLINILYNISLLCKKFSESIKMNLNELVTFLTFNSEVPGSDHDRITDYVD